MPFYHGSNRPFEPGTVLQGRGDRYEKEWGDCDYFWVLELYRPSGFLPHRSAVFMVSQIEDMDLTRGCTEWCLQVEPGEYLSKHDLHWLSVISRLMGDGHDHNSEAVTTAARNYWAGVPHPNESLWEYLTETVTVLHCEPLEAAGMGIAP